MAKIRLCYCEPYEWAEYVEDKLTGRWKTMCINGNCEVYLEIKRFLWNDWYNVDSIIYEEVEEYINECQKQYT